MGIDQHTYFGPFFLCTGITKEVTIQATVCTVCHKRQTTNFCPICGGKVLTKDLKETREINIDPSNYDEDLFNPHWINPIFYCSDYSEMNNVHIFLPNKKFKRDPIGQYIGNDVSIAMSVENNTISDKSMLNISGDIADFIIKFGKHKTLLKEHYKTVEVCYGVIHYSM